MSSLLLPGGQVRPARAARRARQLRAYVALTKPRIVELLLVTTVPAMVLARKGLPSGWLVLATVAGGAFAAGGANAFNMVIDRDIDRVMDRTKGRPLVTGTVTPLAALLFACAIEVAAFVELWLEVNLLSAVLALGAAAFYVLVYSLWLKRTTAQNIVIGGAAGAVPALVGWAAVTGRVGWPAVVLFAVVFCWTPPHFWALAVRYREDYRAAQVPMLPAVTSLGRTSRQIVAYTLAAWAASLLLVPVGHMGIFYGAAATLLGAGFLIAALRLHREQTHHAAMRLFAYSITYLTVLFVAVAVDTLIRYR